MKLLLYLAMTCFGVIVAGCAVGPDYVRPSIALSAHFKEAGEWKPATPQDDILRDRWWEIYADSTLTQLMDKVAISNQNIIAAQAQYQQALALVQQAYAGFFPNLSANAGYARGNTNNSVNQTSAASMYNVKLQSSWQIDLWGAVRRAVEAGNANAASSLANIEVVKLSAHLALAQAYFQLRILDLNKASTQRNIDAYTRALEIARARYQNGTYSRINLITAETQLDSEKIALTDLSVQRAQMEHAIAVLIGQDPSSFNIASLSEWQIALPILPSMVPTQLLERRPDIAAAERKVAGANASIGVAQSAYFPALSLNASAGYAASALPGLLSLPNRIWSIGPALALSLIDGGVISAQVMQAQATYDQTVAAYRQTVLTAIQEVEDNLSALHILQKELKTQKQIVTAAHYSTQLTLNQYQAGTSDYLTVVTALVSAQNNENIKLNILGRYYAAHVGLIAALGGGWRAAH